MSLFKFNPVYNLKRDPVTAMVVVGGLASGVSAISASRSAKKESKAAESAAQAQLQATRDQIAATEKAEGQARETAKAQLKAAQARRTQTILTSPLGQKTPDEQVNAPTILGVPK